MKTGLSPLLLLVEKEPDEGFAFWTQIMPSSPGLLDLFLTVLILSAWQDTMAHTDILLPPDRRTSLKSTPAYVANVGFLCTNLCT